MERCRKRVRQLGFQHSRNTRSSDGSFLVIARHDPAPTQEKRYNIEAVIDRRRNKPGNALYKIKWDGYDMSKCTWESESSLRQDGTMSSSTSGKKKTKAYAINVENPLGFLETKMGNSTYIDRSPSKETKISNGIAHSNASKAGKIRESPPRPNYYLVPFQVPEEEINLLLIVNSKKERDAEAQENRSH